MINAQKKTKDLFERLGATEHRRKLAADRIFRELRKGNEGDEREQVRNPLPNLSPTLR